MPALTIPDQQDDLSPAPLAHSASVTPQASESLPRPVSPEPQSPPERPPVSPLTPVASIAQLAPVKIDHYEPRVVPPRPSTFISHPPPVSIAESDNIDAIALRSAISILQLQREKAKQDIKTLEQLKIKAVADPEGFMRALRDQRAQASASASASDILTPTLAGSISDSDDETNDNQNAPTEPLATQFPRIPQPQVVVRCPPVNWAKYHIVGEPLDKMHEEQVRKPPTGDQTQDHTRPAHVIAAPYSPITDRIGDSHPPGRKSSKRPNP